MKGWRDLRIELWVEPRGGAPAVNPVMERLFGRLRELGAETSVRVPERELIDPMRFAAEPPPDLVLLKTVAAVGVSQAIADEAAGGRFLNGAQATWRAQDKAAAVARLAAAGLPVPATWLRDGGQAEAAVVADHPGEWVSKPVFGIHGHDVVFHAAFPGADDVPAPSGGNGCYVVDDGTRLIQQRIGGDAPDVKVYVADGRCFAGRKRFGAGSFATDVVERMALDRATTDLVLAAGAALELRCYGVDLRCSGKDSVIVDVNPFPGYRGFPEAVPALMSEIERCLWGPVS